MVSGTENSKQIALDSDRFGFEAYLTMVKHGVVIIRAGLSCFRSSSDTLLCNA